ncbi:tRNA uridine 5-carboxymethylaminomethyl modification enzyme MnmG [Vulcanimicrobium alpinum]|uniref:tRNA uridine 5-carboxymethylaminomethyl modification enzyme MnmG n=1 Tax=Vulcanimicrobium alpinum TaxID=3016050 RepID=A0AAN2CBB8_UNVUL|nr:tRNA uridine-5-carboxymethylaminomethyl(34) synthesis enzyme MnmG [Vulcanimicrobium alpinum]BDE08234.1 tRNA uridine 5-carboxymethylaminomethyl modification enzyme MnmG [Vulcanimicrobium alpinum]
MRTVSRGDDAAVIVVGAGHAGFEAALAAARLGAHTLLVTGDPERICTLACNPSIGGSAKGQLVREIDAIGGAMARVTDRVSLHARFLNESKGPSVRALRALADKPGYVRAARAELGAEPRVTVVAGMADDLVVEAGAVRGVVLADGRTLRAPSVVLATGTFLGGKTFRGDEVRAEGRFGEAPAVGLSSALARLGFPLARLKTGTPPRVDRTSLALDAMSPQMPSAVPLPFSYRSPAAFAGPQLPCWIVETSEATHALVRANLHRSPLYGLDLIRGIGPRYCPSIEDKVVKFAHNATHQIFVEPEGWDEPTFYVGGFSTSLPADIQLAMLRTLPGFADVLVLRPGYAVEYDFVQPTELDVSLETRRVAGLFHAGQLNGTSGYEEAAAQGLIAGINAARRAAGREPLRLGRETSYIGVLLDDLVTRGVDEPYRMLTSRAEHRVVLRHDNADLRLTPVGRKIGLVDDEAWEAFARRRDALDAARRAAERSRAPARIASSDLAPGSTLADALRRPELGIADVAPFLPPEIDAGTGARVEIELKMDGYVRRTQAAIERAARDEAVVLPADLDYASIRALSREAKEKLDRTRPRTLGAATRIPGITPTDIALLGVHVHRLTAAPA